MANIVIFQCQGGSADLPDLPDGKTSRPSSNGPARYWNMGMGQNIWFAHANGRTSSVIFKCKRLKICWWFGPYVGYPKIGPHWSYLNISKLIWVSRNHCMPCDRRPEIVVTCVSLWVRQVKPHIKNNHTKVARDSAIRDHSRYATLHNLESPTSSTTERDTILVGGLEHDFFPYVGNSNPNWLIFFSNQNC